MGKDKTRTSTGLQSLKEILAVYELGDPKGYVTREFQDYGYRLALELEDPKHVSLYIKLAKTIDRSVLETARCFVKDAANVKNRSRLFLWKLGQLRQGKAE